MPLNPISTPISISTTSSSSSSTSSSSSSSSSSTPSILLMTTTNASNDYSIKYNDLNERLFSCLLSNFSCQLVDQFLATQFHTGFIRKQKENKSFTFINIFNNNNNINNNNNNETDLMNESDNSAHNRLDLTIDKQNIKLCLKLNKWPLKYKLNYFERKRSKMWPNKSILDYLETKTCLITCSTQNESQWQLDTQLAELYLFKSLNKHQKFQFYFIYNIYMQMSVSLGEKTKHLLKMSKLNMYQLVNERMFKHHYFRFIELETLENEKSTSSEESNKQQANLYLIQLLTQIKKFISYMKNQLNEYKTFNSPNYFDLNKSILNDLDYSILLNKNLINVIGNENYYCCLKIVEYYCFRYIIKYIIIMCVYYYYITYYCL